MSHDCCARRSNAGRVYQRRNLKLDNLKFDDDFNSLSHDFDPPFQPDFPINIDYIHSSMHL
jgi:hypothetical protein